jgi:two-component system chemotaxis response regulator CheY
MRIHIDNAKSYLQAVAACISKDPASLENWQCLHIEHSPDAPAHWYESALARAKGMYEDVECDAILCQDHDILMVTRHRGIEELHTIATELKAMGELYWEWGETTVYDMFKDWQCMYALLREKSGRAPIIALQPQEPTHYFGEVGSLTDIFNEVQKRRKSRLPMHVMVVEDDPLTRHLVTNCFKEEYAIITAVNGQEAVANYMLHAPDIVFLDIGLPDASGFDVLRQIMTRDPDAYVVMFSANSYLDNVTEALGNGASGFIAKPFKKDKMRHYIMESAMHHRKNLM